MFRWGEAERARQGKLGDDLRTFLGQILYLIRFPLMELHDYGNVVRPSGILNDKDSLMMYDYFVLSDEDR